MKPFLPIIKSFVYAGVALLALKANEKYGLNIDKDALAMAIMTLLASIQTNNEPEGPPRLSPPKD